MHLSFVCIKYSRADELNLLLSGHSGSKILSRAYEDKENVAGKLSSVLLRRIIKVLWGDQVKLVSWGPNKVSRMCYLNLQHKEHMHVTELPGETFEQFWGSSLEMGRGWSKTSDNPNNVSFLRFESCLLNSQRLSNEVRILNCHPLEFLTPLFLMAVEEMSGSS